jgi:hypothetical protein
MEIVCTLCLSEVRMAPGVLQLMPGQDMEPGACSLTFHGWDYGIGIGKWNWNLPLR